MTPERPSFSLAELERRWWVSRRTAKRAIDAGKMPGAFQLPDGTWRVPLEDVLAAGWRPRSPVGDAGPPMSAPTPAPTMPTWSPAPAPGTSEVERRVVELELRVAVAESLAVERERTISALRDALERLPRQLEPGPAPRARSYQRAAITVGVALLATLVVALTVVLVMASGVV